MDNRDRRNQEFLAALDAYKKLHVINKTARSKIVDTAESPIPESVTKEELDSLEAESTAWNEALEIARRSY